ncbi:MAG: beta-lactamase family protein [Gemmatimonadota bacterium]|nr:beta-lactamase family protein [Gemmatimonadota bacterium]
MLRRLLPPRRREWPDAMLAELEAIPDSVLRHPFAAGCVRALVVDVVAVRLRSCAAHPQTLALALAAGLAIAMLDQASDTRRPMWIALGATSALFAWWRPVAAWRWGLLVAAGIPLLAAVSDTRGPYAFDQADAMYGIVPAILVAMIVAFCRRRIRLLMISFVAISLATGARITNAQSTAMRRELTAAGISAFADSAFADYLQSSSQPSLAFVVVKDGAIIFARGYGAEDAAGSRPVDPDMTIFWLASLSKLVTTDAVMREVERGRIALGDSAMRYFEWQLPSPKAWRAITVEDLLTHTHGLDEPFMQGIVDDVERLVPLCDYVARVRWRVGTRPGDMLRYSNHGIALAGCIVERTSGMPFAEYVEREIFAPVGMTRSTFRQPVPAELARRIATAGTDQVLDYLLPTPAGAMVGTASDMGRFLVAQLDAGGPRAASLRAMHTTQWRGHRAVPGVALGWFETSLGRVRGLYHTGARHHFSVAWLDPSQRVGLFLVHSMRQGGPFQNLRTNVVRDFVERYYVADTPTLEATASRGIAGVYRPALLSTTTVERAGYLLLDTPVRFTAGGNVTMHAPGGLGTVIAHPTGDGAFEVRTGPQADLRLGFIEHADGLPRIAMGGTLLDPVLFTRLAWWQRGFVHAVLLVVSCLALVLAAAVYGAGWVVRRRRRIVIRNPAWAVISAGGLALALAVLAFAALIFSTPDIGAAEHMRSGLRTVLALLSAATVLCGALPLATFLGWRRGTESIAGRVTLCLLSSAGMVAAVLLWHYRLVGFHL